MNSSFTGKRLARLTRPPVLLLDDIDMREPISS